MGLLSKLKSMLGMEEESRSPGSGVDVTVERESSTGSERSADESGGGDDAATTDGDEVTASDGEASVSDGDVDEPVAADADAAASTESLVDEEHAEDPTRAAEPAEAAVAEGESDDAETAGEEAEAADEDGDGDPVSSINGIGPAYADRLEEAGIDTVDELADADAAELAERTDLSEKRVGRWIDSARDHD